METKDTKTEEKAQEPVIIPASTAVGKYSVSDAAIQTMKDEYLILKIAGIEDKNTYDLVYKSRQIVKKTLADIEKKRVELKAPVLKSGKDIDDEAKRLTKELEPIQKYLLDEETRYEDLKEAKKREEENRKKEIIKARTARLVKAGMQFDGVVYFIPLPQSMPDDPESVFISLEDIATLSDEHFNIVATTAEDELKHQAEQKLAEEKRLWDEKLRIETESQELEKKKAELAKETEDLLKLKQDIVEWHEKLEQNKATIWVVKEDSETAASVPAQENYFPAAGPNNADQIRAGTSYRFTSPECTTHSQKKPLTHTEVVIGFKGPDKVYPPTLAPWFWDELTLLYPEQVKIFGDWIDNYKAQHFITLFGTDATKRPKYHHLPIAFQIGMFMEFALETNGMVYLADSMADLINQISTHLKYLKESNYTPSNP